MANNNNNNNKLAQQYLLQHPYCANCGATASEVHHIIPLVLGGADKESNMVSLCYSCHNLIHGKNKENNVTRSELIKAGIAKSNKKQGRKPGQVDKLSDELKNDIRQYLSDKSITQKSLIDKYHICRNTLKKYVALISEQEHLPNVHIKEETWKRYPKNVEISSKGRVRVNGKSGKLKSKAIQCIETQIIYPSMREAERVTGISHSNISEVCNGKRKTAGGFHWRFIP